MGGKAKECYRTISLPESVVGGLPKPEYTVRVSETEVRGRYCWAWACVCAVFCIHTPSGCCFRNETVRRVPAGVNMTISIIQS